MKSLLATSRYLPALLLLASLCMAPAMAGAATPGASNGKLEAPLPAAEQPPGTPGLSADATARQGLWQELGMTPFIREGANDAHTKATIYAFFDPNCIFCHLSWKLSQPYLKTGLQIRWIPIAFVQADSAAKVAWLLTSKNPSTALNEGESGWKRGVTDGGGAFLDAKVTPAIRARIEQNETLFKKLGLNATPSFVYQDQDGEIHTVSGITNQHMFSTMTGLPFVPTTDPDLMQIPK